MSEHVAGIALSNLKDPAQAALQAYVERTDGQITFDLDQAVSLTTGQGHTHAAHSNSPMRHRGEIVGNLHLVALAPTGGTGSGQIRGPGNLQTPGRPNQARIIPQAMTGTHTEVHLTIASFPVDAPTNTDPLLFAGNLELLTPDHLRRKVKRIGYLGQGEKEFDALVSSPTLTAEPTVTFTTGYTALRDEFQLEGTRFGDPHAVYNAQGRYVQLCGFLALSDHNAAEHFDMFKQLGAMEPAII